MLSRSPGPRRTRDWTRSRWRRSRARVRHARELSLVEGRDANGPAAAQRLRCQHGRAGPRARPKDPADHGEDAPLLQPRSLQDAEPSPGRRAPRDPQALPEARGCGSADPARVDRCCPLLDITRSLRQHIGYLDTFFCDLQEWEWIEQRFDRHPLSFALTRSRLATSHQRMRSHRRCRRCGHACLLFLPGSLEGLGPLNILLHAFNRLFGISGAAWRIRSRPVIASTPPTAP